MLVAESLTALFFPFTWLKPYVPIVPASNLHFIEAPVPYIMGFHHANVDKDTLTAGQRCFVDIDSGTVSCPEGLPDFADKATFGQALANAVDYFRERRTQARARTKTKLHLKLGAQRAVKGLDQICTGIGQLLKGDQQRWVMPLE